MSREGQASGQEAWRAHVQKGQALLAKNAIEEALEALTQAHEVAAENTTVQTLLALAHLKAGNWAQSASFYESLADASQDDVMLHLNAAVCYIQLEEHDKARPHLEDAIALQPDFVKARSLLGTVYRALGWFEEAKEQFEKAGQDELARQMEAKIQEREAEAELEMEAPVLLLQGEPSEEDGLAPGEGDHEAISAEFNAALDRLSEQSSGSNGEHTDGLDLDDFNLGELEFDGLELEEPAKASAGNIALLLDKQADPTGSEKSDGASVVVLPGSAAAAVVEHAQSSGIEDDILEILPFSLTPPAHSEESEGGSPVNAAGPLPLWVDVPELFDSSEQVFALLEDGRLFIQVQQRGYARLNDLMLLIGEPSVQWESKRFQGKPIGQLFGPRDNPIARIEGPSYLLLSTSEGRKRTSVLLAGADVAYFREGAVLAFGPEIQWENGRVPSALTGISDLPLDNFWGEGELILESQGPIWGVPVKRDKRVRVEYERLVGWVGSLIPQIIADESLSPSLQMRAFVEFEGEGGILISS